MKKRPTKKYRRCKNGCGAAVAVPGYCPGCKALRALLSEIHGDRPGKPTAARDAARRRELHRERAAIVQSMLTGEDR